MTKSKIHSLKLKSCYWESVINGSKKAEIRNNDRDFQTGDVVFFTELHNTDNVSPLFNITHVLHGGQFGIDKDYCVLSIELQETKTND